MSFYGQCAAQLQRRTPAATCSSSSSSTSSIHIVRQAKQQPVSRRQLLHSAALLVPILHVRRAAADVTDLERILPGEPLPPPALPKAYQRTMHKLVSALQTAIAAEASGAKEAEVRRKADPAKELVKEFVGKWQDNMEVVGDITHDEMKSAIAELGRFYQKNGPRSRLSEEAKQSVLAHLAAVEAALPEEEKSLLGF